MKNINRQVGIILMAFAIFGVVSINFINKMRTLEVINQSIFFLVIFIVLITALIQGWMMILIDKHGLKTIYFSGTLSSFLVVSILTIGVISYFSEVAPKLYPFKPIIMSLLAINFLIIFVSIKIMRKLEKKY